jgi:hypothetical protein
VHRFDIDIEEAESSRKLLMAIKVDRDLFICCCCCCCCCCCWEVGGSGGEGGGGESFVVIVVGVLRLFIE